MAAFKCNHDIQSLCGGKDAVNRIYYCCKYVTKPQLQIDSTTAVVLASFQRREAKEAIDLASDAPPTPADLQRRRVSGMVHTFTNKQEIAGPLAALYLLRGSCCYSSDTCAKLPLTDVLKQLQQDGEYTYTLVRDDGESPALQESVYRSASFLNNYIYRPQGCDDLNLYEFTMRCYHRQRTPSSTARHLFGDQHPLYGSHCIAFRQREAVPVIKGQRLPRFVEGMTEAKLKAYAKIALVLLKPFRILTDLVEVQEDSQQRWYSAYSLWEGSRTDATKTIMQNMDDYHAGCHGEDDATLETGDKEDSDGAEHTTDESDDDGYGSEPAVDVLDEEVDNHDVLDIIMGSHQDQDALRDFPNPSQFPPEIRAILTVFKQNQLVEGIARCVVAREQDPCVFDTTIQSSFDVTTLKMWVKDPNSDSTRHTGAEAEVIPPIDSLERPTTVNQMIDEALLPSQLEWESRGVAEQPVDVPMYSGISTVSGAFTLNSLQHGAFAIVATHLLHRWRYHVIKPESNGILPDTDLQRQQLLLYMGGEGGTGKSRVINAIQEFCQSWQRPQSVIVTALTGKAASIINGQTLASLEMSLKSAAGYAIVQDVECIIIDEVSMMSKNQLLRLDRLLRTSKRVPDVPFGGLFIIFVGDFLQLPPVQIRCSLIPTQKRRRASMTLKDSGSGVNSAKLLSYESPSDFEKTLNGVKDAPRLGMASGHLSLSR